MFLSKPRIEVTEKNLNDGENILIKAMRYQISMAIQTKFIQHEAERDIELATRDLITKIIEQERTKLHLLMIGDFIFRSMGNVDPEIRKKLNDLGDARRLVF